jgi:hypothetical protein
MIDKEAMSSQEERPDTGKCKAYAISSVIGICEGPQDLAEKHDSYAHSAGIIMALMREKSV